MPSSTSVSDIAAGAGTARVPKAAWLLLAGCVLLAVAVEGAARVAVDASSRIQRRMVQEYVDARAIGAAGDTRTHLLVVGNSLLDEGVAFDRLRAGLPDYDAHRFMVEQTYYYDWLYGLKRLYREGARPDVVVVMLAVGHWTANSIRGDYSAQYLFNAADLASLSEDLHLHPTVATSLYFANFSKFWGVRAEMRNFLIGHTMPDVGRLMNFVAPINRDPISNTQVEQILISRLTRLNTMTAEHRSRLVVLVPPLLNAEDGAPGLMRAAERAGVPVLRPVPSGAFGAELYRDAGFHLNEVGAAAFTDRLIPMLKGELTAMASTNRRAIASAR